MDSKIFAAAVCAVLVAAFSVDPAVGAPPKDQKKDAAAGSGDAMYTTKYDNVDIDQILASRRLVNSYVQCLLDKKPCTPEGTELRRILPDALKTQCAKCNTTQKKMALKVVNRIQKDYEPEWKQLLDKWDPKREYLTKFEKFLAEEKKKGTITF